MYDDRLSVEFKLGGGSRCRSIKVRNDMMSWISTMNCKVFCGSTKYGVTILCYQP